MISYFYVKKGLGFVVACTSNPQPTDVIRRLVERGPRDHKQVPPARTSSEQLSSTKCGGVHLRGSHRKWFLRFPAICMQWTTLHPKQQKAYN